MSLSIRYLIYQAMSSFQANATIMTLKLKDESKRDGPRQATCVPCLHWIQSRVDPNVPWSNNAASMQQQPLHYCCVRRSSPTTFLSQVRFKLQAGWVVNVTRPLATQNWASWLLWTSCNFFVAQRLPTLQARCASEKPRKSPQ